MNAVALSKRKKIRDKIGSKQIQYWMMCIIPVLLVFIFSYVPMFGIIIAFKDYRYDLGIFGSKWIGFGNFKFFLQSNDFIKITWNTLYMNFLFIVLGTAAAVGLAIMLYGIKRKVLLKLYQTVYITPHFLSWVVVAYMVYAILHPQYGFLNIIIEKLGGNMIDWYSEPKYWPAILTICNVWKTVGMNSIIYYAALMGVDSSLFEAAEIDGATKTQINRYILVPSLIPLIMIMTILAIGNIFRADFGLFYNVPRNVGTLYDTTDVVDTYVYRAMISFGNMGISCAIGLLQSVVGFILVVLTNHVSKKIDPDNGLF